MKTEISPELREFLSHLNEPGYIESFLSPEEVAEYKRCQQSVIDARRAGERIARELWIG
jgi:hypothetical protein